MGVCAVVVAVVLSVPAGGKEADFRPIDAFAYATDAARELWRPMGGSPPVSVVEREGRRALRMPCRFAPGTVERASWDRLGAVDMTACKGVQFLFRCRDASPIGHFTMYFRSGKGWYSGTFHPTAKDGWGRVRIHKSRTRIEGAPAGWGKVDAIRLSAWRGRNVDTEIEIAELGLFGTAGKIAVVRGDSAAAKNPGEARGITQYAEVVVGLLEDAELDHVVLSDRDVTAERLKGRKIVILPYNPSMPAPVVEALARFIEAGGKLVTHYCLPGPLQPVVGIRSGRHVSQEYRGYFASIRASDTPLKGAPASAGQASWNVHEAKPIDGRGRVAAWWYTDKGESTQLPAVVVSDRAVHLTHVMLADDRAAKGRLLLAMLGHLAPELWAEAARGALARVGRFEPYEGFGEAVRGIREQAGGGSEALGELNRAARLHSAAHAMAERGAWVEAIAKGAEARAAALRAHCLAQNPLPGEHRALWCHSAFGVAGLTWDQAIKTLADNGFTAVLPNMLWGGVAFYDSDVLPVAPEVREKGDQVALCLAACRKYGVECHVWKVNWNMCWRTPRAFAEEMKAAGRTQVKPDGSPNDRWLCPSHPANRKLEIDAMVEVARKYDVHGVHFDYIRYPGREGCYCDGCRSRFEEAVGRKATRWPADVGLNGPLHAQWMDFRRRQITAVVQAVAEQVRAVRPGVEVSAAVFRDWPADRDTVGQDWKLWCDRGWLDFVCPMDYTPHNEHFRSMVSRQVEWSGKVRCYPGIGLSVWPDRTDVAKLIAQVRIARSLGTKGFTIFNYDPAVAGEVLPMMGLGTTKK